MKYPELTPCLDQAGEGAVRCPGCERGLDRTFVGWVNVIWYDGPMYPTKKVDDREVRDYSKEPNGMGDVLAVWERGITTFEELDAVDVKWKGITTRDAEVERTGTGFDTRYRISPALADDGSSNPTPLSPELEALVATKPVQIGRAHV